MTHFLHKAHLGNEKMNLQDTCQASIYHSLSIYRHRLRLGVPKSKAPQYQYQMERYNVTNHNDRGNSNVGGGLLFLEKWCIMNSKWGQIGKTKGQ